MTKRMPGFTFILSAVSRLQNLVPCTAAAVTEPFWVSASVKCRTVAPSTVHTVNCSNFCQGCGSLILQEVSKCLDIHRALQVNSQSPNHQTHAADVSIDACTYSQTLSQTCSERLTGAAKLCPTISTTCFNGTLFSMLPIQHVVIIFIAKVEHVTCIQIWNTSQFELAELNLTCWQCQSLKNALKCISLCCSILLHWLSYWVASTNCACMLCRHTRSTVNRDLVSLQHNWKLELNSCKLNQSVHCIIVDKSNFDCAYIVQHVS